MVVHWEKFQIKQMFDIKSIEEIYAKNSIDWVRESKAIL